MAFCDRLRSLREEKGLTLYQLSRMIGVSEATVQRYESGEIVNPRRENRQREEMVAQKSGRHEMADAAA